MLLREKLTTFVLSEEGAISKSAVLSIGAVLSIVALAAMPGPAEAANCEGDCYSSCPGSYSCTDWQGMYYCDYPYEGCQLQYRTCCGGTCFEYQLKTIATGCPPGCFCY